MMRAWLGFIGICLVNLTLATGFNARAEDLCPHLLADRAFLQTLQDAPADTYFQHRYAARQAAQIGADDFGFAPHLPIVQRIIKDLRERQTKKLSAKFKDQLEQLAQKAEALLASGLPPYKATARFIMYEYLPMLDLILAERHPELMANEYHRKHAESDFENKLNRAPDLLIYFSFEPVSNSFFLRSRPAPMQLVGIDLRGLEEDDSSTPHADNFAMKNSEFAWHDVGHIDFMAMRDLEYIYNSGKPIERIVYEWDVTRRRVVAVVDQVRLMDPDLADAMELVLVELLHERGFQYSLTVLKTELDTYKWVEVIERKLKYGFFRTTEYRPATFQRIDEARKNLSALVGALREHDQQQWIETLHADLVPSQIIHTPVLQFSRGHLIEAEIRDFHHVQMRAEPSRGIQEKTSALEVILAQVNPSPDFLKPHLDKIEALLDTSGSPDGIDAILVHNDRTLSVRWKNGRVQSFADAPAPARISSHHLEPVLAFKIRQMIGSFERGEPLAYTLRRPPQTYRGWIRILDNQVASGRRSVGIRTLEGQILQLPLVEVRIDPLSDSPPQGH